ncbi:hypothetical protein [Dyadobacter sp. CY312]|uniref:hypothetical protein n=1 Tax=Dyadobacter sp. CY312 TaxID=2907303 RepID=UPI001F363649|nr:hypothetical protein [Dyadobacter sp. CY312]MCE7043235.1 hypothetical protein [Dyadobacter sp. CY312]
MEKHEMPENGAVVRFRRSDGAEWVDGEFDEENQLFIEIYSAEPITHHRQDIVEWEYLDGMN